MSACSYPSARLGEFAFTRNKGMIARAEGDVRSASLARPVDVLKQRPAAFTRHSVMTIVVTALVALAAWAFLPVCLQVRFRLHVGGRRIQCHIGVRGVFEHAVDVVQGQHHLMSLLVSLEGADAIDKCTAESPRPNLCLVALSVHQVGVLRAALASLAFKFFE